MDKTPTRLHRQASSAETSAIQAKPRRRELTPTYRRLSQNAQSLCRAASTTSVGCQAEALKLLGTLDLFGAIAFDNVADLDVLVTVDANAALVALLDRLDIVFEAAQR